MCVGVRIIAGGVNFPTLTLMSSNFTSHVSLSGPASAWHQTSTYCYLISCETTFSMISSVYAASSHLRIPSPTLTSAMLTNVWPSTYASSTYMLPEAKMMSGDTLFYVKLSLTSSLCAHLVLQ